MQQVHERCTQYAMAQCMHPQRSWEQTGFISRRLAPQTLEMPEMLYKICLVARELDVSYARCSAGVRIGSPCLVRRASTMQCLARAAAMLCTSAPREENSELVRQPHLRTPWPGSKADAQGETLGRNSL